MGKFTLLTVATGGLVCGSAAFADIVVTQQNGPAPTYSNLITFDEPGTPSGLIPPDFYASLGLTLTDGVNNGIAIGDFSGSLPWLNSGQMAEGNFGARFIWDTAVTELSFQMWDASGAPTPFGGGVFVALLDENEDPIETFAFTGAWGGIGNSWYDVTTSNGSSFHGLVIFNSSFGNPSSFVDNVSWNFIPTPGVLAMFALGLGGLRSRRR